MALTVTLAYTDETPAAPYYVGAVTDQTVYGGANAARNTVAVYFTGNKLKQDGTTDAPLTIATYDPLTAATFSWTIYKDGWNEFKYVVIPFYAGGTTYNRYDLIYSAGVVYQYTNVTPSSGNAPPNAVYWAVYGSPTAIVDAVGTATAAGNISGLTPVGGWKLFDQIVYPYNKTTFGNAAEAAALECCMDCERSEDVLNYEYLGVLVDGMNVTNQRSKFSKGEKMARKADEVSSLI